MCSSDLEARHAKRNLVDVIEPGEARSVPFGPVLLELGAGRRWKRLEYERTLTHIVRTYSLLGRTVIHWKVLLQPGFLLDEAATGAQLASDGSLEQLAEPHVPLPDMTAETPRGAETPLAPNCDNTEALGECVWFEANVMGTLPALGSAPPYPSAR